MTALASHWHWITAVVKATRIFSGWPTSIAVSSASGEGTYLPFLLLAFFWILVAAVRFIVCSLSWVYASASRAPGPCR